MTTTLAERLRQAMSRHGSAKAADLARACGVTQPTVSAWLSGDTKVLKAANYEKAATFLKCNRGWLETGKGSLDGGAGAASIRYSVAEPPPAYAPSLDALLAQLQAVLEQLPASRREAVGRMLDGWAREGGAAHYRGALLAVISADSEDLPRKQRRSA